jgi:hypothetical protein
MGSANSTPDAVRLTNFGDLPQCDRCQSRTAVVRFERSQVCVFCFTELDRQQPFIEKGFWASPARTSPT